MSRCLPVPSGKSRIRHASSGTAFAHGSPRACSRVRPLPHPSGPDLRETWAGRSLGLRRAPEQRVRSAGQAGRRPGRLPQPEVSTKVGPNSESSCFLTIFLGCTDVTPVISLLLLTLCSVLHCGYAEFSFILTRTC